MVRAGPQLLVKKTTTFVLLLFDSEVFKTCKNTIKLLNLCALPCVGVIQMNHELIIIYNNIELVHELNS